MLFICVFLYMWYFGLILYCVDWLLMECFKQGRRNWLNSYSYMDTISINYIQSLYLFYPSITSPLNQLFPFLTNDKSMMFIQNVIHSTISSSVTS